MIADGYSPGSQFGYDLGAALQTMVTAIVQAIASLVRSIADFIQNNAPLFATILDLAARVRSNADVIQANAPPFATGLGHIMIGTIAIRFGREAIRAVVSWLRDLF